MRYVLSFAALLLMIVAIAGVASAQTIVEDFDSYTPGLPPGGGWWTWGDGGSTLVDDTVHRGPTGNSIALDREAFPGTAFAFGRLFDPIDGQVIMEYSFRVSDSQREMLSAFATDDGGALIGPWVTVGFPSEGEVHVYSESLGWLMVLSVQPDTWYRVILDIDVASNTYDITIWNEDDPADNNSLLAVPFRTSAGVPNLGTIQFGEFSSTSFADSAKAWVDDVLFMPFVFWDGFESGDTAAWSSTVP